MLDRFHAHSTKGNDISLGRTKDGNWVDQDGSIVKFRLLGNGLFEVHRAGEIHEALIVKRSEEFIRLSVTGRLVDVRVESAGEQLIKKLGLDKVQGRKLKDLKAPMPGKVLKVLAEEEQEVAKGDALLVLEAMKMENLIKAAAGTTVGQIVVKEGQAVEKGELLMKFK